MYIAIVKAIMKLYISIIDMQKLWFNLLSHIFIVLAFLYRKVTLNSYMKQIKCQFIFHKNFTKRYTIGCQMINC